VSRISLTGDARQDLKGIYDFITDDNITAAQKQIRRLQERWRVLLDQPRIGTKRDDIRPDMRSITEGNYAIFYRVVDSGIQIIRVLHTSMDAVRAFKQMQD
jgi:toxin ParE1/3/4